MVKPSSRNSFWCSKVLPWGSRWSHRDQLAAVTSWLRSSCWELASNSRRQSLTDLIGIKLLVKLFLRQNVIIFQFTSNHSPLLRIHDEQVVILILELSPDWIRVEDVKYLVAQIQVLCHRFQRRYNLSDNRGRVVRQFRSRLQQTEQELYQHALERLPHQRVLRDKRNRVNSI